YYSSCCRSDETLNWLSKLRPLDFGGNIHTHASNSKHPVSELLIRCKPVPPPKAVSVDTSNLTNSSKFKICLPLVKLANFSSCCIVEQRPLSAYKLDRGVPNTSHSGD